MAKEITVNALGENVKITVPDVDSYDNEYYADLPHGFSLNYQVDFDDHDNIIRETCVSIYNKNGDTLSEYADSFVNPAELQENLESLTRDAIGNMKHDIENKLKEATRTINTYYDVLADINSQSVKGPGE